MEDLFGGVEADDAFERWDRVLTVRRDEFRDLVLGHALFLKGRVGQLFADVVGHLNDHSDRIRHAGFLHPFRNIRSIVVQQVTAELFGFFGDASFHGSARRALLDVVGSSLGILQLMASYFHCESQIAGY